MSTTPAEDFAAFLAAQLGTPPAPEPQPPPEPARRAPRPDPSQGRHDTSPTDPSSADALGDALLRTLPPPTGDGGWEQL